VKAPNRQLEVQLKFRVTPEERALIEQKMEQLGIYEVAPEDFALAEYADTSKLPLQ